MKKYLAIIGTTYPEIHGATKVTDFFYENTKKHKLNILNYRYRSYLNPRKKDIYNTLFIESKLAKLLSFFTISIRLFKDIKKINALYIQENGGFGKIYDIYFLIFFLLFRKRCFYCNHTYKKIIKYDFLTKVIQLLSSFGIKNIFLNKKEADKFIKKYGNIDFIVISNSVFIKKPTIKKRHLKKNKSLKFGLISNLNKSKGLDLFIDIAKKSSIAMKKWEFHLAGPVVNKKEYYLNEIQSLKNIKYYGPIYDSNQKQVFYQNLDFFIFFTTYKNESEPLVVLESTSNGCIPIVYNQGSLSELVPEKKLILKKRIDIFPTFKSLVEDIILNNELEILSSKSRDHFKTLKINSEKNMESLMLEIKTILNED